MIAKQTIIGGEQVLRGTPLARSRSAQSVAHMAVALQWHVATNANEPVALATSRSAETGIGEKDVLLVVADCTRRQAHDARIASALAHHIFGSYNARQSKAADNGNGADRLDMAHWLSDAVISGLKQVSQHERVAADGIAPADEPVDAASLAVVATVIHHDKLFVARYGGGRVYLLRGNALQNLTDSSFATAHAEALEPDLGQLDLAGEDRVLLCSDAFHAQLNDTQIKSVLRGTPSSRRAAQTLLDAATRTGPDETIALAVADYVTGRAGVFPTQPIEPPTAAPVSGPRRGTFRSIAGALGIIALVIAAVLVISSLNGRSGGIGSGTNTTVNTVAPNATLPAAIAPISATATATSEPSPTVAPSVTPAPTSTNTPEPTATLEPTPTATWTPEPTATAEPTATPTAQPTRRPTRTPAPTAVPTETPIPPTPTPEGPTPTPTITPVPPWELQPPAPPQPPACDPSTLPPGSVCP